MPTSAKFALLLVAACVVAGLYGALHDQVSYTVSPEYFTKFKFDQFLVPDEPARLSAALVGWYATWWMGLIIGVPVLTVGLLLPDDRAFVRHGLIAFAVVAGTALAVGLAALAVSFVVITPTNLPIRRFPPGVTDPVAFARVGFMHGFSYLGGLLGIVTGCAYLLRVRARLSRAPRR